MQCYLPKSAKKQQLRERCELSLFTKTEMLTLKPTDNLPVDIKSFTAEHFSPILTKQMYISFPIKFCAGEKSFWRTKPCIYSQNKHSTKLPCHTALPMPLPLRWKDHCGWGERGVHSLGLTQSLPSLLRLLAICQLMSAEVVIWDRHFQSDSPLPFSSCCHSHQPVQSATKSEWGHFTHTQHSDYTRGRAVENQAHGPLESGLKPRYTKRLRHLSPKFRHYCDPQNLCSAPS